jgi:hypothetical protein
MSWSKNKKWRRELQLASNWQKQYKGMNLVIVKSTMTILKKGLEKTRGILEEVYGGHNSKFNRLASMLEYMYIMGMMVRSSATE